jgi:hypothetical protein
MSKPCVILSCSMISYLANLRNSIRKFHSMLKSTMRNPFSVGALHVIRVWWILVDLGVDLDVDLGGS